jgi:hypothetical protein
MRATSTVNPNLLFCDHLNDIWWRMQIVKFLITQFSQTSCYS